MVVQIFSFFVRQLLSRLWEVSKQLSPHAAHFSRPFLPPPFFLLSTWSSSDLTHSHHPALLCAPLKLTRVLPAHVQPPGGFLFSASSRPAKVCATKSEGTRSSPRQTWPPPRRLCGWRTASLSHLSRKPPRLPSGPRRRQVLGQTAISLLSGLRAPFHPSSRSLWQTLAFCSVHLFLPPEAKSSPVLRS